MAGLLSLPLWAGELARGFTGTTGCRYFFNECYALDYLDVLRENLGSVSPLTPDDVCGTTPPAGLAGWHDWDQAAPARECPLDEKSTGPYCQKVLEKYCANHRFTEDGREYCGTSQSQRDAYVSDPQHAARREYIAREAVSFFSELKSSPDTVARCCAGATSDANHVSCNERISSAQLFVIQDAGAASHGAHYDPVENAIKLDAARLFTSESSASVKRMIAHELGHLCQHSHSHAVGRPLPVTEPADPAAKAEACKVAADAPQPHVSLTGFGSIVDSTTAACVKKELTEIVELFGSPDHKAFKPCASQYYEEAFANLAFTDKVPAAGSALDACWSKPDSNHPPNSVVFRCDVFPKAASSCGG